MKHLTLSLLLISGIAHSSEAARNILEHIEQYAVDSKVAAILDTHSDSLFSRLKNVDKHGGQHGVWTFDDLPGYYVKYGLSRIWGMELMRQVIEDHNLDLLTLPDKRIYHLKGRPKHVNNTNYCVVIKKVNAHGSHRITKEQMRQLITLIRETKYISLTHDNYLHVKDGKLCIIDTESNYDEHLEVKGYLRLLGYGHNPDNDFTEAALKLLFEEMKRLLDQETDRSKAQRTIQEAEGFLHGKPQTWDYVTYFKEYFADYRN